jgi:hypothetical protein
MSYLWNFIKEVAMLLDEEIERRAFEKGLQYVKEMLIVEIFFERARLAKDLAEWKAELPQARGKRRRAMLNDNIRETTERLKELRGRGI